MKPTGETKVSGAKITNSEAKVRKYLHVLQPAATNKENLVGPGRPFNDAIKKDIKNTLEKQKKESTCKKIDYKHKAIQTDREEKIKIEVDDLTSEAGPSENYWEVLAERRRIALDDALEENKELHERVSKLQEENRLCKEMLDETRALVEVLQEMIEDDRNDIHNSLEDSAL
ncbi:geminin-like isoform X1 [Vespa mandarinia]|uniref:geminin-like isoform X1 n=1 Tax=Vespa mandarinia TaxID=7446 RepID=UPI001608362E|nr:geminin-like isoform X1 [Vespa mandarinia]